MSTKRTGVMKLKDDAFVNVSQLFGMEDYVKIEEVWFCEDVESQKDFVVLQHIDAWGEVRHTRVEHDNYDGLMANILSCNKNKEHIKKKFSRI